MLIKKLYLLVQQARHRIVRSFLQTQHLSGKLVLSLKTRIASITNNILVGILQIPASLLKKIQDGLTQSRQGSGLFGTHAYTKATSFSQKIRHSLQSILTKITTPIRSIFATLKNMLYGMKQLVTTMIQLFTQRTTTSAKLVFSLPSQAGQFCLRQTLVFKTITFARGHQFLSWSRNQGLLVKRKVASWIAKTLAWARMVLSLPSCASRTIVHYLSVVTKICINKITTITLNLCKAVTVSFATTKQLWQLASNIALLTTKRLWALLKKTWQGLQSAVLCTLHFITHTINQLIWKPLVSLASLSTNTVLEISKFYYTLITVSLEWIIFSLPAIGLSLVYLAGQQIKALTCTATHACATTLTTSSGLVRQSTFFCAQQATHTASQAWHKTYQQATVVKLYSLYAHDQVVTFSQQQIALCKELVDQAAIACQQILEQGKLILGEINTLCRELISSLRLAAGQINTGLTTLANPEPEFITQCLSPLQILKNARDVMWQHTINYLGKTQTLTLALLITHAGLFFLTHKAIQHDLHKLPISSRLNQISATDLHSIIDCHVTPEAISRAGKKSLLLQLIIKFTFPTGAEDNEIISNFEIFPAQVMKKKLISTTTTSEQVCLMYKVDLLYQQESYAKHLPFGPTMLPLLISNPELSSFQSILCNTAGAKIGSLSASCTNFGENYSSTPQVNFVITHSQNTWLNEFLLAAIILILITSVIFNFIGISHFAWLHSLSFFAMILLGLVTMSGLSTQSTIIKIWLLATLFAGINALAWGVHKLGFSSMCKRTILIAQLILSILFLAWLTIS